jgi:superfamily II DNA or RNA helicase
MQFGPVRYTVDPKQLIAESGMAHIYRQRRTPFKLSADLVEALKVGDASPQEVYRALAEDEARNYMIFDDVLRSMDRGRCPVVLTTRRDHLENLHERFKPHVRNVVVLKGAMKASERRMAEELMARPADEERLILATGQFLGEGFDDARLDALFMTMPTIWEGTLEQYSGRLQRSYVGKSSVEVIDYVDEEEMLSRKAEDRMRVFKRLGFTIDAPDTSTPYTED